MPFSFEGVWKSFSVLAALRCTLQTAAVHGSFAVDKVWDRFGIFQEKFCGYNRKFKVRRWS